MKRRRSMRMAAACAIVLALALASGCGGGDAGGSTLSLVTPPTAPTTTADPAPTIPVTTPPDPQDPTAITRFTATVPFGEKGDYQSSAQVVYGFGTTAVADAQYKDVIYTVPLQGTVRYPAGPASTPGSSKVQPSASGGHPVVVFLHGMHDSSDLNNAKGYDYLQKDLAEHGYVAFSIDAGKINGLSSWNASDAGAFARGQLLMTTLDLLRAGNATGLFNGVAMPELKGKLDLERVGIVGHSRGAEAVAYAVELNKQRIGISYQDVETARRSRELVALAKAEKEKAEKRVDEATAAATDITVKLFMAQAALLAARIQSPPASPEKIDALTQALQQLQQQAAQAKERVAAEQAALEEVNARFRDVSTFSYAINADSEKWLAQMTSPEALLQSGVVLPSATEPPHRVRAVFSLAPINARQLSRVTHVPFATLLPTCDGDVYNMPGAQIFDDSRNTASDESAPKYQVVVRGANHNFYNDHWSEDDDAEKFAPLYCQSGKIDTLRLSPDDQRRNGAFLMASFLRYFVGDEFQFAPYWKGQAPIPSAGCPAGESSCDERVVLTVHQPAAQRKLLQDFRNVDASAKNESGLSTTYERFKTTVQCRFLAIIAQPNDRKASCTDPVSQLPAEALFEEGELYNPSSYDRKTLLLWSITDQAQLQWDTAGPVVAIDTGDLSAQGLDTLSVRVAVLAPIGQEVEIALTDTQGRKAALKGSDFSDALYGIARKPDGAIPLVDAPGDAIYADTGTTRPLLNMVAVPLKAFAIHGVDLAHIRQVTLRFPKAAGSVAVTDVQLQRMN
jgi:predicted dienelactone hydrolase